MRGIVLLVCLLLGGPAWATTRYVDAVAGACTGTYSIASRNCGGSDGNSYATITAGVSATASGDTLYVRTGTYAESMFNTIPAGLSSGAPTTIAGYNGETVTIKPNAGALRVIQLSSSTTTKPYVTIRGIILDGANVQYDVVKLDPGSHYFTIEDCEIRNSPAGQGILTNNSNNGTIRRNRIHGNGNSRFDHGIYISAGGNDWVIESNTIYENAGQAIALYPSPLRAIVTYNLIYNNSQFSSPGVSQVHLSNDSHLFAHNIVYRTSGNAYAAVSAQYTSPTSSAIVNNTFYAEGTGNLYGVYISSDSVGITVANNHIIGYDSAITDLGAGSTVTTNRTTGSLTDCTVSTSTFLHKTSSACINAGTNVGYAYNGSAPDQGAYETFDFAVGTITGNTAEVTLGMNLDTPVVPTTAGWSLTCTPSPTACPTTTITGAALKPGSSSIVILTYSGAACASGQTWTVSYDSATGATTDSIPFLIRQSLSPITTQSLTNGCSGPPIFWTGNLSVVATQFFYAKTSELSVAIPLAGLNTNIRIPAGAIFTYVEQTDCTVSDCTPIAQRLYYTCATCPSAGLEWPVPNTASTDGIEFYGSLSESGLLDGAEGTNLAGVFTHVPGSTNKTEDSIPVFQLNQNNSTVQRYIGRIVPGTPMGRTYCLYVKEQSGVDLNSKTPSGGLCLTTDLANAGM